VESRCGSARCPLAERANANAAYTLGDGSTLSLVLGGVGVAAGSILLIGLRPGGNAPPATGATGAALRLGVGRFDIEGSF